MSSVAAGTTVGTGLVHTSDTTGDLVLKTGASATTAMTISGLDQSVSGSKFSDINGGQIAGFRNRIINGAMGIDQRNAGASQTFTAAAALAYCVDRFYGYCTGANVTGARVAGSGADRYRYQFTGAASVTAIGFAQRIEADNCYDLNGTTATLSVVLANSLLTTVNWAMYYANSADTFGTLASPTRTSISSGSFTVTSTATRYSTSISIPSAATTGIEIVFTVGAQVSGTWTIGNVQLESGAVASTFERRGITPEIAMSQRYYAKTYDQTTKPGTASTTNGRINFGIWGASGAFAMATWMYPVAMRVVPAVVAYSGTTGTAERCTDGAGADQVANYGSTGSSSTAVYITAGNLNQVTFQATASAEL